MKSNRNLPQPFAYRDGFRAQITNPNTGIRETKDFERKREAQEWIAQRAMEMKSQRNGHLGGPEVCTLAELLTEYACLYSHQKAGCVQEVNRINSYLEVAGMGRLRVVKTKEKFNIYLEDRPMSDKKRAYLESKRAHLEEVTDLKATLSWLPCSLITKHNIEELMSAMAMCGNSTGTIQKEIALLKTVFNTAIKKWQWSNYENPTIGLKLGKSRVVMPNFTVDTVSKLFELADTCGHEQMGPLVRFALETLIRKGQLLALKWSEVNLDEGWCDIPAKLSARSGVELMRIPLNQAAVKILTALKGKKRKGQVFDELTVNIVDKVFKNIQKQMGDDAIRFHDLRHIGATLCARAGMSAHALRNLLGHKTMDMALVYVQLSSQDIRHFIDEKMGGGIFPNTGFVPLSNQADPASHGARC